MSQFGEALTLLMLAAIRPGIIFLVVPFFSQVSEGSLPHRILIVVGLGTIVPILWPTLEGFPADPLTYWMLAGKEVLVGSVFAMMAGTVIWAVEAAGELIDQQRGATIAGILNPFFGATNSALGGLFSRLAVAIFHASAMYLAFFGVVFGSYAVYPLLDPLPSLNLANAMLVVEQVSVFFRLMIIYAAPVLIVFLLIDLGLGFANRFVQSLNVFFLSMPIKSGMAFFLLIPYTGILMANFVERNPNGEMLMNFVKAVLR